MLVIRMQRTGRKGHAMFRVVVQDSRRTPTSGKIVAQLGSYDPHTKAVSLNKEKAAFYLEHGAQPSGRVALLLKSEGVKLPKWVALSDSKTSSVRNADKRRSTRPAEEVAEEPVAESAAEVVEPEASPEETPEDKTSAEAAAPTESVADETATSVDESAETESKES